MRRIRVIAAAAVLTSGLALTATPAQAAVYLNVCNSSGSDSTIRAYDKTGSPSHLLDPGECWSMYNGSDNVRVDVEASQPDVNSYKIGEIGVGYGPCHEDSENAASNPADSYNGNGARYKNYTSYDCYEG